MKPGSEEGYELTLAPEGSPVEVAPEAEPTSGPEWIRRNLFPNPWSDEELGVTQDNVADEAADPSTPQIAALLGAPFAADEEVNVSHGLEGLDDTFMQNVIAAVGNYGEIFDRHLGPDTDIGLERGLNALWTDGGLQYGIPFR